MKMGTTGGTAKHMKSVSTTGVRKGGGIKNVQNRARRQAKPSGPTGSIRGMDRGGV